MVVYAGGAVYKIHVPETKSIISTRDVHMMEYSSDVRCTPEEPEDL